VTRERPGHYEILILSGTSVASHTGRESSRPAGFIVYEPAIINMSASRKPCRLSIC